MRCFNNINKKSKTLKKLLLNILLILFTTTISALPASAIKIGLIENAKETNIATSTVGTIYDTKTGRELMQLTPMTFYTLKNGRNSVQIKINKKYYSLNSKNITIKTQNSKGFIYTKKHWYREDLQVLRTKNGLTVINDINLELYLLGVVPSEMPSSWNIEAHKAQAIAARSYAIANLGKRATKGFDLKDTPEDQAYGGASSETIKTTKAVMDTKGQVLINNNKIISAYYHASAGGKTKNSGNVWNKNLPYLHSVPSFDANIPKNGHGVGMSQHGANHLANKGYNAYQILGYFYTKVQLSKINI